MCLSTRHVGYLMYMAKTDAPELKDGNRATSRPSLSAWWTRRISAPYNRPVLINSSMTRVISAWALELRTRVDLMRGSIITRAGRYCTMVASSIGRASSASEPVEGLARLLE